MTTSRGKHIVTTEDDVLAASKRNVEVLAKKIQSLVDALDLVAKARTQEFAQGVEVRRARYKHANVSKSAPALLRINKRPTRSAHPYVWADDAQRAFDELRESMPLAQRQTKATEQHATINKWLGWAEKGPTDREIPRAVLITQLYTELHMTTVYRAALHLVDYRMRNNLAALNFPGLRWCSRLNGNPLLTALRVLALLEMPADFEYEGGKEECKIMYTIVVARDEMPAYLHLWESHRAKRELSDGHHG